MSIADLFASYFEYRNFEDLEDYNNTLDSLETSLKEEIAEEVRYYKENPEAIAEDLSITIKNIGGRDGQ